MAYVLVIDDDEDFAAAAALTLRSAGYEVAVQHDPEAGMAAIQVRRPDLVVLDVMFPESASAGFDVARKIAGPNQSGPPIPVLMLTAVNSRFPLGFSSNDIDSDWLPVADFVEKPVDLATLPARVSALLAKTAAARK
ncbi:MAG: response regulator [Phycisphaerae bacterium]|nr:response regulator [Phycisphaerae bacterium]